MTPRIHIEIHHEPHRYTSAQLERAFVIARAIGRGKLVLVEPPAR
jgi:hypothetical protein